MSIKVRVLLSSAVVLTMMSLAGCNGHYNCGTLIGNGTCSSTGTTTKGGGGTTTGSDYIVDAYFVDYAHLGGATAGLTLQQLDATAGTFTAETAFVPPTLPALPTGMVIVYKQYIYISSSDGTVYGYTIDLANANLTPLSGNPYTVTGGTSIATNPEGNLLFVGDTIGQRISVFTVGADGSLTLVPGSPFSASGVSPKVMTTDGKSRYLYASAGTNANDVGAYAIGTSGALTPVVGTPFPFALAAITGEPSGQFLLGVTGQTGDDHVHVLAITPLTGVIAEVSGSPFATHNSPVGLAVHPTGAWVYTFNEGVGTGSEEPMEGYTLNSSTGVLTEITGSPFTDLTVNGGVFDQSGQFLFGLGVTLLAGNTESTATPYTIDLTTGVPSNTLPSLGFPGIADAAYAVVDAQ